MSQKAAMDKAVTDWKARMDNLAGTSVVVAMKDSFEYTVTKPVLQLNKIYVNGTLGVLQKNYP